MNTTNNSLINKFADLVNNQIFNHNSFEIYHIDYNNFNNYIGLFMDSVKSRNPAYSTDYILTNKFNNEEPNIDDTVMELKRMIPFSVCVFSRSLRFLTDKKYAFFKNYDNFISIIQPFSTIELPYGGRISFSAKGVCLDYKVSNVVFDGLKLVNQVSYYLSRDHRSGEYTFDPYSTSTEKAEFSISYYKNVFHLELISLDGVIKEKQFLIDERKSTLDDIAKHFNEFLLPFTCLTKSISVIDNSCHRELTKKYCDYFEEHIKPVVEMVEY